MLGSISGPKAMSYALSAPFSATNPNQTLRKFSRDAFATRGGRRAIPFGGWRTLSMAILQSEPAMRSHTPDGLRDSREVGLQARGSHQEQRSGLQWAGEEVATHPHPSLEDIPHSSEAGAPRHTQGHTTQPGQLVPEPVSEAQEGQVLAGQEPISSVPMLEPSHHPGHPISAEEGATSGAGAPTSGRSRLPSIPRWFLGVMARVLAWARQLWHHVVHALMPHGFPFRQHHDLHIDSSSNSSDSSTGYRTDSESWDETSSQQQEPTDLLTSQDTSSSPTPSVAATATAAAAATAAATATAAAAATATAATAAAAAPSRPAAPAAPPAARLPSAQLAAETSQQLGGVSVGGHHDSSSSMLDDLADCSTSLWQASVARHQDAVHQAQGELTGLSAALRRWDTRAHEVLQQVHHVIHDTPDAASEVAGNMMGRPNYHHARPGHPLTPSTPPLSTPNRTWSSYLLSHLPHTEGTEGGPSVPRGAAVRAGREEAEEEAGVGVGQGGTLRGRRQLSWPPVPGRVVAPPRQPMLRGPPRALWARARRAVRCWRRGYGRRATRSGTPRLLLLSWQVASWVAMGGVSHEPHILLVPLLVGSCLIALGLWGVWHAAHQDAEKAQSTAHTHVNSAANTIASSFASSLLPLAQLASTIKYTRDYNQLMEMWPIRAPDWWSSVPKGVQTLRMTPFGRVAQLYPLNNETKWLIGVDVMAGDRRANSLEVLANRNATPSGPVQALADSLLVRIPVFIANVSRDEQFNIPWNVSYCPAELCYIEETRSKFWGFAVMGMDWFQFLESHGNPLKLLEEASGLQFQLVRPPNDFTTPPEQVWQVVQGSGGGTPADHFVMASINVLGREWLLYAWTDSWTPSYMVPLMVVVVVVSLICTVMLFIVLLTRAEHNALLRSLLPKAAIHHALETWRWSNEQETEEALTMLMQGTPAEAMMAIVADLLVGNTPPISTVAAVRSALEAGANIYQPLRKDLSNRMAANDQMDSEVKAALMGQLLGQGAERQDTLSENSFPQETEHKEAKQRQSVSGAAVEANAVSHNPGQEEHADSAQADMATPGHLPWRPSHDSVHDNDPYGSIEGALMAITGVMTGGTGDGAALTYGRNAPGFRMSAPTDVSRTGHPRAPAVPHQRASAHAWIPTDGGRTSRKSNEGGRIKAGWLDVTPLEGLSNARASLTALLKRRSKGASSHGGAPSGVHLRSSPTSAGSEAPAAHRPQNGSRPGSQRPTPERAELQITLDAVQGPTLTAELLAGLKENEVVVIDDPGRPIYTQLESILHTSGQWTFNAFALEDASCGRPLSALGFWLFHWSGLIDQCHLNRAKLARFLMAVEDGYLENPYHNRRHAADVLRTLHVLLMRGGLAPGYADNYTVVACYLAAIVHDFEHLGFNNDYLVNSQHDLALRYNDRSPMENHHLAAAWTMLRKTEYNFLERMGKAHWRTLRKLVVDLVLSTDMKQHFAVMGQFSALHRLAGSANSDNESNSPTSQRSNSSSAAGMPDSPDISEHGRADSFLRSSAQGQFKSSQPLNLPISESDQLLSLQVAMKLADLGHMATPLNVHRKWVRGLEQEFFLQGDKERAQGLPCSPLCDRTKQGVTKSQIGFFEYVVIPLFTNYVHRFSAARPLYKAMMRNFKHWQAEAKAQQALSETGAAAAKH